MTHTPKHWNPKHRKTYALAALLGAGAAHARADEGMWPYNALPKAQIQKKYGYTVTDAWAAHLQRSSGHAR